MARRQPPERKELGAFDTPPHIVRLMLDLCRFREWAPLRVLEPACGYAPFSEAVSRLKGSWQGIVGVEVDPNVAHKAKELHPELEVRVGDYLLMEFGEERFDLIVGNPPYGIIGDRCHYPLHFFKHRKPRYKQLYKTWRGKYNIYGLFLEKSLCLLADKGVLCFIVPATWMILDDFGPLRKLLAQTGRLEVYYLGKGVFQSLSVVTVILLLRKGGHGLELYDATRPRRIVLNRHLEDYTGAPITFRTRLTENLEASTQTRLGDLYDVRISPRSTEVKECGLLTPHRAPGRLPLLAGRNLVYRAGGGQIEYDQCYTGLYIDRRDIGRLRPWFLQDRVVVAHTRGGRLLAALDKRHYAWTGDIYHLAPKPGLNPAPYNPKALVELLNSPLMNRYVRDKYREITPHTTKTQLLDLPLPPPEELKALAEIFSF
jgi:adenine-specific DNA-methyltransferase